jgi:hypothetical protein
MQTPYKQDDQFLDGVYTQLAALIARTEAAHFYLRGNPDAAIYLRQARAGSQF